MPVAVIISQGLSGPTAGMGFSEVSSHWCPGSPQSSLRHLTLPLVRTGDSLLSPDEALFLLTGSTVSLRPEFRKSGPA